MDTKKQQWKRHVDIFRWVYALLSNDEKTFDISKFDEEQIKVIDYIKEHKEEIFDLIKPLLSKTWTWERTKTIDKAIIIGAYGEQKVTGVEKKIIIDQAIINAKNYSDVNSYKFVNAILDKII
ncbi:MAG: transcription antitermination protein NusB [Mycoplasmataceae bacterium]|jgi:N utilization substance protein B|nr:transcription antitermination protein NusB [Mycoplasmataceae bacterium]